MFSKTYVFEKTYVVGKNICCRKKTYVSGEKKVLFLCGLFEHARVRGGQLVRAAQP